MKSKVRKIREAKRYCRKGCKKKLDMHECNVLRVLVVKLNKKPVFTRDSYVSRPFVKWYINAPLTAPLHFRSLSNVSVVIGSK